MADNLALVTQNLSTNQSGIARRITTAITVLALIVSVLALSPQRAEAAPGIELYDTAWDMPFWATLPEVTTYLDYLDASGHTGLWISLMNHTSAGRIDGLVTATGTPQGQYVNGQFDLDPEYAAHVTTILDLADARGLRVGMLPMWGVGYLHGSTPTDVCNAPLQGLLRRWNSRDWGEEVGAAFGQHPALQYWIMGGDNFCDPGNPEEAAIWANMAAGIESTGATQDMSYHSAAWSTRQRLFADEPWVDFLSPQTGHCATAAETQASLEALVAEFGKPVIAAEMRYEIVEPEWPNCPLHGMHNPVGPADVLADAEAALAAGVVGMLYGHNERWSWGRGQNGSLPLGWPYVQQSFGAPGEALVLDLLGLTPPPPTVLEVIAAGTSGTEEIAIEVAGSVVATHTLTQTLATYTWSNPTPFAASDVRVLFTNDNGLAHDVLVDAIVIDGMRFETEAATTESLGSWSGADCGQGFRASEVLHCNGWFHYDQPAPPPPTVPPTVPSTTVPPTLPPTTVPPAGSVLELIAHGTNGDEQVDIEVGGAVLDSVVLAAQITTYSWATTGPVVPADVRVLFTNDDGLARDVFVDAIVIDGVRHETEAATTESFGSWSGTDCGQGFKGSEWLHCNGWFHYGQSVAPPTTVPPVTVPPTAAIEVLASGTSGTEVIELEIAGQVVATEMLNQTLTTYSWTHPVAVAPSDVRVLFTNDNGLARDVFIDAITIDGVRHETEAATTESLGVWSGSDCGQGFRASEWIHCNGWVRFGP